MRKLLAILMIVGCNAGDTRRNELDSILRSEDSVRMNTDIATPLININEILITNDPDIDFARLMRQYYIAGLSGAEIELDKGRKKEALAIAKDQLAHHKGDIDWLDEYLHNRQPRIAEPAFYKAFVAKLKQGASKPVRSNDFDIQFLELVIQHHKEALLLTDVYSQYATDSALLKRFRGIAAAHRPEIEKLKRLSEKLRK